MKLERLHESIRPTIVLLVGFWLAILFGYMIGNGRGTTAVGVLSAFAVVAFLLVVRERIWMIIPGFWMLNGKVSLLPLPATVAQLAVLLAFGTYLILKAFKIVRFKPKVGLVEIWMLVVLAYMLTVFIRNPVGTEAFGSERVGGRPYFDIMVAVAAFWVLARTVATAREAFIVPLLGVIGYGFHALINAVAYRFPSTIGPLAQLYSGIAAAENPDTAGVPQEGGRLSYLQGLGSSLISVACSFWRPFTIINPLYFWRFLVFSMAAIAVLQSGFRSSFFGFFEFFLLASYFRRGWTEVFRAGLAIAGVLTILVVIQGNLVDLPYPAQRALSFLPGKWDYAAKGEAEGSTEWRTTMWKTMLTEDKYIENKWLGDGFGFTKHQLDIMTANNLTGSTADQQENLMISGGVHSGPITTIRYAGFVGLGIFMILLFLVAARAARLIRRAKDTPYYPLALITGIPTILLPFNFVLIFGAFENDLPNTIFVIGMQRLLENSLDAYEARDKAKTIAKTIEPPRYRPTGELVAHG